MCPSNCTTNCASGCQNGHWNSKAGMPTYMTYAPKPTGPWSKPQIIATPECNTPPVSKDLCLDSNFNGLILPNGSVLAIGRQAVYTATDWRNASSYQYSETSGMAGEDPSIWFSNSPGGVRGRGTVPAYHTLTIHSPYTIHHTPYTILYR
jgi:hypothetical protein